MKAMAKINHRKQIEISTFIKAKCFLQFLSVTKLEKCSNKKRFVSNSEIVGSINDF